MQRAVMSDGWQRLTPIRTETRIHAATSHFRELRRQRIDSMRPSASDIAKSMHLNCGTR